MTNDLLVYCQLARRERLSLRAALRLYRAAGGRVRTGDFGRVYRAAAASLKIAGGQGERAA